MAAAYWAVVPAAGSGQRMGTAVPKQYLPLAGRSVLAWTLDTLLSHPRIAGVVLAVGHDDPRWRECVPEGAGARVVHCDGGVERGDSVQAALALLARDCPDQEWVLVHDAVRPCVHPNDLERLVTTLETDPVGGLLAAPCTDTIKQADAESRVGATLDRRTLWRALTPQMFPTAPLRLALEEGLALGATITDEASAMERAGYPVRMVEGRADNIKVTRPEDLSLAGLFLDQQNGRQQAQPDSSFKEPS